jgi:UPF0148 protein
MSDFDEEAERERLREKYERDEQKREVTERMSELLLKGATMTNAHCEQCGDPIFRYDGQEFCATCQRAVERPSAADSESAEEATEAGSEEASANGDAEEIEVATPSEETHVQFGGEPPQEPAGDAGDPDADVDAAAAETAGQTAPSTRPSADASAPAGTETVTTTEGAEAELARSVATLSRRATGAADPGEAKALLEAAREAAEALSALRT